MKKESEDLLIMIDWSSSPIGIRVLDKQREVLSCTQLYCMELPNKTVVKHVSAGECLGSPEASRPCCVCLYSKDRRTRVGVRKEPNSEKE